MIKINKMGGGVGEDIGNEKNIHRKLKVGVNQQAFFILYSKLCMCRPSTKTKNCNHKNKNWQNEEESFF